MIVYSRRCESSDIQSSRLVSNYIQSSRLLSNDIQSYRLVSNDIQSSGLVSSDIQSSRLISSETDPLILFHTAYVFLHTNPHESNSPVSFTHKVTSSDTDTFDFAGLCANRLRFLSSEHLNNSILLHFISLINFI